MKKRVFKEELKNYFRNFEDVYVKDDGSMTKGYYSGFRTDRFEIDRAEPKADTEEKDYIIDFSSTESLFDNVAKDWPAQYANDDGTPLKKWENVKTTLKRS